MLSYLEAGAFRHHFWPSQASTSLTFDWSTVKRDVSESACKIVTPSREQRGRHTFCQRYLIRRRALLPSPNVNRQAMSAIPEFCVPRRCGVCRFKLDYGETIIVSMLARCQFTYIKLLTRVPSKTKRYNSVKGAPISFRDARDIHALLGMPTLLAQ